MGLPQGHRAPGAKALPYIGLFFLAGELVGRLRQWLQAPPGYRLGLLGSKKEKD